MNKSIVTARKRSMGKVIFHRRVSFCSQGVNPGCNPGKCIPQKYAPPPEVCTPLDSLPLQNTDGQQALDTHPSEMHTCFRRVSAAPPRRLFNHRPTTCVPAANRGGISVWCGQSWTSLNIFGSIARIRAGVGTSKWTDLNRSMCCHRDPTGRQACTTEYITFPH